MNDSGFFLRSITISNFRGYLGEKTFNLFSESDELRGIVLLGGPNGFGKTTLLDAIEWCFTGQVRRLVEDFKARQEKSDNKQYGLLRHSRAKQTDSVFVKISGQFNGKLIEIYREFNKGKEIDGLSNKYSKLKVIYESNVLLDTDYGINCIEDTELFNFNLTNSFYDRYTSSQEKNIRIYQNGRKDFYEMFSSFLGGTDEINRIEVNLEGSSKPKTKGLIQQLKEKISTSDINANRLKNEIEEIKKNLISLEELYAKESGLLEIIHSYPKFTLFEDEQTALEIHNNFSDSKKKNIILNRQLQTLNNILFLEQYKQAYNKVNQFLIYLRNSIDLSQFDKHITDYFFEKEKIILNCSKLSEEILNKQKDELERNINLIQSFKLNNENIKLLVEIAKSVYQNAEKLELHQEKVKVLNLNLEKQIRLKAELDVYNSTNKSLVALRAVVDNLDGFEEFRNQNKLCPLCGSESLFSNKTIELGLIAKEFLGEIDKKRAQFSSQFQSINAEVSSNFSNIKSELSDTLEKKLEYIKEVLSQIKYLLPFKQACIRWNLDFKEISKDLIQNMRDEILAKCINRQKLVELEEEIILLTIDDEHKLVDCNSQVVINENASDAELRGADLYTKEVILKQFKTNFEKRLGLQALLINMEDLNSLDITHRKEILESMKKGSENTLEIELQKQKLTNTQSELTKIEDTLKKDNHNLKILNKYLDDVRTIRTKWEREVAIRINSPLNSIYKRINRHNYYEKLSFQKPDRGKSKNVEFDIQDTNGNKMFIPNVVSAGQLSSISIATFLTIAMGQINLPFRCYFMDDPIQSMDDINVLSFIDLLRVELSSGRKFINQLFMTTCNEDFEQLILHKMNNFGVNISHFKFNGYGSFT